MLTFHTVSGTVLCFALLYCVEGTSDCDSKLCKGDQVCDGGTCYNSSSKIDCHDGIYYCWKPRKCCGVGTCCPEHAECCGFSTCCPPKAVCCGSGPSFCCESGSTCCGFQNCCPAHSDCDGGVCTRRPAKFHWWYILVAVGCVVIFVPFIVVLRRIAAKRREAGLPGGVILHVAAPTQQGYGYDQ